MTKESTSARSPKMVFKAYLYGHYDSRGGATLISADNFLEALQRYLEIFCVEEVDDMVDLFKDGPPDYAGNAYEGCKTPRECAARLRNSQIDELASDFIRTCTCVFFDAAPDEGELDADYVDGGFRYGVLESRVSGDAAFSEHEDVNLGKIMVFWRDGQEMPPVKDIIPMLHPATRTWQYGIEREELGEDACGLCLQS